MMPSPGMPTPRPSPPQMTQPGFDMQMPVMGPTPRPSPPQMTQPGIGGMMENAVDRLSRKQRRQRRRQRRRRANRRANRR
jgi:hypothetical protein